MWSTVVARAPHRGTTALLSALGLGADRADRDGLFLPSAPETDAFHVHTRKRWKVGRLLVRALFAVRGRNWERDIYLRHSILPSFFRRKREGGVQVAPEDVGEVLG